MLILCSQVQTFENFKFFKNLSECFWEGKEIGLECGEREVGWERRNRLGLVVGKENGGTGAWVGKKRKGESEMTPFVKS